MLSHILTTLLSLASIASATDIPTLYLVGDSTMANMGSTNIIQGWGQYIKYQLTGLNLENKAVPKASARSYRNEYWDGVQGLLNPGDFVVIEFGHNEGGSFTITDRASVPGEEENSQKATLENGTVVDVYTWPHYIKDMIDGAKNKSATPIISSLTPWKPSAGNTTSISEPPKWVNYASHVAVANDVAYVDHHNATLVLYAKHKADVNRYFTNTNDSTHTTQLGADQVAKAFINGLQTPAARGVLSPYIKPNATGIID